MLDLEERIGAELRAIADGLVPSERLDGLVQQRARHHERRRRLARGGATVAASLALLVGAVGLLTRDGPGDHPSIVAGDDSDEPLFLVPDPVPDGFALAAAGGGDRPGAEDGTRQLSSWARTQRWVRFDAGGHPAEVVDVAWGDRGAVLDPLGDGSSSPVTVRGHAGTLSDSGAALAWQESEGLSVAVTGTTAEPAEPGAGRGPLDPSVLTGFAEELVAREGGGFDVPAPPAGFELAGEAPGTVSLGENPRLLVYEDAAGRRRVQVHVVDDADLGPGMSLLSAAARRVEVRGGTAVLTPSLALPPTVQGDAPASGGGDLHLLWEEDGALVTVSSLGLDESELLAFAGDLQQVDATTWFALQAPDEGEAGPASEAPSAEVPATSLPSIVAGEPAAGAEQFTGTYSGTEHYSVSGDRCEVESTLDAEHTLTDGSVWQYHANYCGEIEGDNWVSETGTATFTLPDGSTLTAEMLPQSLPVDTDGAPYGITIIGGTGAFALASGACQMDNHLTDTTFGTQLQNGTFICEITSTH